MVYLKMYIFEIGNEIIKDDILLNSFPIFICY